jgi:hypothetical protein
MRIDKHDVGLGFLKSLRQRPEVPRYCAGREHKRCDLQTNHNA